MQERYTSNGVIERGYAIYDEWNKNKYRSRTIVNSVQTAVASTNAKMTPTSHIEALSHLFALDLRVKERYNTVIQCIFLYFSWRRETKALKRFMGMLHFSRGEDIRTFIELELKKLEGDLDKNKADDTHKNTAGGKITEFSGKDIPTAKGDKQQAPIDDGLQETPEAEENEKEYSEVLENQLEINEKSIKSTEKPTGNENNTTEKTQKESEGVPHREKTEEKQRLVYDNKTEFYGTADDAKPIKDKIKTNDINSGAIDSPPPYHEMFQDKGSESTSFIDEVIMDNMINGKDDIIGHNPLSDVKQTFSEARPSETDTLKNGKDNDVDKIAYLYDKMVIDSKGGSMENLSNSAVNNQSDKNRIPINVDPSLSTENAFRRSINDTFTAKMIAFQKSVMESAMREEFKVFGAETGISDPVRILAVDSVGDKSVPVRKK